MYKVVRKFKDKDGIIYNVGDNYPNTTGKKPTNARVKTLSTDNNDYGCVYIVKENLETR